MFHHIRNRRKGFTLIELAIVLTIAGLLFAGLWRLLSGGNQQIRDQAAASQQQQLISAMSGWLVDTTVGTGGAGVLQALGNNGTKTINLPAAAAPCNAGQLCNYLPAGFNAGTVNSYGQNYNIQILKDNTPAGTTPNTYSFMIATSGGDTIPDTSGGRISAAIGNDGGFIYTNLVCGATANKAACGSYGTWAIADITAAGPAGYGFAAALAVSGHIASRTYSTPSANTYPWLARPFMPGDNPAAPVWNSMQTDLFLGANANTGNPNNFWLGANNGLQTGGGTINMQGGEIVGSGSSEIALKNLTTPINGDPGSITLSAGGIASPLISASNACVATGVSPGGALSGQNQPGCTYSIVSDNIEATQFMYANSFYAPNFNYNTASDIRFKKDIEPLKNALADIMQLKPVAYRLKTADEKSVKSMGVIAQDLEKVYPQLVTTGDMKYVKYEELIAPLIGAVQELKGENDRLRQELQTQKKRQDDLEKKIEQSGPGNYP